MKKKYSGAGNKFIIINDSGNISDKIAVVKEEVKIDPEIDGVIFIEASDVADFKMNYYNKDGTGNALCGNGLRCTAKFIHDEKLSGKDELTIESVGETFHVKRLDEKTYSASFPPPKIINPEIPLTINTTGWWLRVNVSYTDVGSPHVVIFLKEVNSPHFADIEKLEVDILGKLFRYHKDLMPEGANVNFVEVCKDGLLKIRSYERGVEGETLACGTGCLSAALAAYLKYDIEPPVRLLTKSGDILEVNFEYKNGFEKITLTGPAERE